MPEWLVMTLAEKLELNRIFEIKNAEVRREFVRKVGIDRLKNAGKLIEESNGYKLIDLGGLLLRQTYAPYLVMENPSLKGIYHAEGVHPQCKMVRQALNWRNQTKEMPEILT